MASIATIIPVRNWSGWIVLNSITSVRPLTDELIIVDVGSSEPHRSLLCEYARDAKARLVRLVQPVEWAKNMALNVGIRHARSDKIALIDADCIVPPSWRMEAAREIGYMMFRVFYHPMVIDGACSWKVLKDSPGENVFPNNGAWSCVAFDRSWIERIGGLDEDYRGCGYEDTDLHHRAVADGLSWTWATEPVMHQNHARILLPDVTANLAYNQRLFKERFRMITRNEGRAWGSQPSQVVESS